MQEKQGKIRLQCGNTKVGCAIQSIDRLTDGLDTRRTLQKIQNRLTVKGAIPKLKG
jgi:hypothetical protein